LTVSIYKPIDTDSLLLFGQIPIHRLPAETMQHMLTENRNHIKHRSPLLSLSEKLDTVDVHFKLTQPELEATDNVMEQLIANLEYWRTLLMCY